jgi:serine/threonine protein kinase
MHTPEITALRQIRHPSIIRLEEVIYDQNNTYAVLEYANGKSFKELAPLREDETLTLIAQAAGGLLHVHQKGFVYNDMSPANIRKVAAGIKILDFEYCIPLRTDNQVATKILRSTPGYRCADQIMGVNATENDVFGLGATAYFMLKQEMPFMDWQKYQTWHKAADISPEVQLNFELACLKRPLKDLKMHDKSAAELLQSMLSYDARDRPTMRETRACLAKYLR